jgi:hypothetical protein
VPTGMRELMLSSVVGSVPMKVPTGTFSRGFGEHVSMSVSVSAGNAGSAGLCCEGLGLCVRSNQEGSQLGVCGGVEGVVSKDVLIELTDELTPVEETDGEERTTLPPVSSPVSAPPATPTASKSKLTSNSKSGEERRGYHGCAKM